MALCTSSLICVRSGFAFARSRSKPHAFKADSVEKRASLVSNSSFATVLGRELSWGWGAREPFFTLEEVCDNKLPGTKHKTNATAPRLEIEREPRKPPQNLQLCRKDKCKRANQSGSNCDDSMTIPQKKKLGTNGAFAKIMRI
jgi:hypothetical protein